MHMERRRTGLQLQLLGELGPRKAMPSCKSEHGVSVHWRYFVDRGRCDELDGLAEEEEDLNTFFTKEAHGDDGQQCDDKNRDREIWSSSAAS